MPNCSRSAIIVDPVFTTQQQVLDPWGPKCPPSGGDTGWVGDRSSPTLPKFGGTHLTSTIRDWKYIAWDGGSMSSCGTCGVWGTSGGPVRRIKSNVHISKPTLHGYQLFHSWWSLAKKSISPNAWAAACYLLQWLKALATSVKKPSADSLLRHRRSFTPPH